MHVYGCCQKNLTKTPRINYYHYHPPRDLPAASYKGISLVSKTNGPRPIEKTFCTVSKKVMPGNTAV